VEVYSSLFFINLFEILESVEQIIHASGNDLLEGTLKGFSFLVEVMLNFVE
jgi:hypothetical protein